MTVALDVGAEDAGAAAGAGGDDGGAGGEEDSESDNPVVTACRSVIAKAFEDAKKLHEDMAAAGLAVTVSATADVTLKGTGVSVSIELRA